MTDNPYAAQIEAGAAWLDENHPDWVKVFAADKADGLHMENCDRCVLGYVLGSYWDSNSPVYRYGASDPAGFGFSVEENERLIARAGAELGFSIPRSEFGDSDGRWEELGDGWKELIHKRLADAGLMA